ncbi:MAG: hypothetical protein PVJ05_10345 [Candidatus Thorarchaeota archaeon]|jgi:hypothetical protein
MTDTFIVVQEEKTKRYASLKVQLQPIPIRPKWGIGKEEFGIAALNDEFVKLILELTKKWAGFEEIRGRFRIYREKDAVILELEKHSDILNSAEEDLDS